MTELIRFRKPRNGALIVTAAITLMIVIGACSGSPPKPTFGGCVRAQQHNILDGSQQAQQQVFAACNGLSGRQFMRAHRVALLRLSKLNEKKQQQR